MPQISTSTTSRDDAHFDFIYILYILMIVVLYTFNRIKIFHKFFNFLFVYKRNLFYIVLTKCHFLSISYLYIKEIF